MPLLFFYPFIFWCFMSVRLIFIPNRNIYTRTMLYGVGRAQNDAELRNNLRLIAAVLLAGWSDTKDADLSGQMGEIFDILTSEKFYTEGYNTSIKGENDRRLWFCSYIGFEKLTSKWARENHPDCHGYICMRVFNQDDQRRELDHHTIQIYF